MRFHQVYENLRIRRELIPHLRAEIMAERIAKVSAIRGDVTEEEVTQWEDDDPASSMIQPKHAHSVAGFQAAYVYIQARSGSRRGSWLMLGFDGGDLERGIVEVKHSQASWIVFTIYSIEVKTLFWKTRWFLEIHRFQKIQAESVPAPKPTSGRDVILQNIESPLLLVEMGLGLEVKASGAKLQTSSA